MALTLSAEVVIAFCRACQWASACNVLYRCLFDDNPGVEAMIKGRCGDFMHRLSVITHEYSLLQIAKLHDPAVQRGRANLTIAYMVEQGGWDPSTLSRLATLRAELDSFAKLLRPARNADLSHNDLATAVNDVVTGVFPQDADRRYFALLQEFVNVVHDQVVGGIFSLDDLADNDAAALLAVIPLAD